MLASGLVIAPAQPRQTHCRSPRLATAVALRRYHSIESRQASPKCAQSRSATIGIYARRGTKPEDGSARVVLEGPASTAAAGRDKVSWPVRCRLNAVAITEGNARKLVVLVLALELSQLCTVASGRRQRRLSAPGGDFGRLSG